MFSGKMDKFDFFGLNLAKNRFLVWNSEKNCWNKNQHPRCVSIFRQKTDNFDFFGPNLPQMDFWLEIQKTNVGIRISFLWDTMCSNFETKRTTLTFLVQICPKKKFWVGNSENWCWKRISILEIPYAPIFRQNRQLWLFGVGFRISTSKIPWVPIFSQNGQLWIFWPKFGEIAQLRAIFWFEYCWGCCRELGGGLN